jgi:hypothetical protein
MGHAHHFLSRLDRVSYDEVELSLGLYNNAPLVRYILSRAGLPARAERVAISLDDRNEGPFLIVTREGRFVTCLGRGMRCDQPVVRRWQLDALAERHEELKACMRPSELVPEHERSTTRLFKRITQVGADFSREDFLDLAPLQPLLLPTYLKRIREIDSWLFVARHNLRHVERPRPCEHELMQNVWGHLWALKHLSALVGVGTPVEYFEDLPRERLERVKRSDGTVPGHHASLPIAAAGAWLTGRFGGAYLPICGHHFERSTCIAVIRQSAAELAAVAGAHPRLRDAVLAAFRGLQPERTPADCGAREERATLAAQVLAAFERTDDLDVRAALWGAERLLATGHPSVARNGWRDVRDVPVDVAMPFAASAIDAWLSEDDNVAELLRLAPSFARYRPEDLYLPRRWLNELHVPWAPADTMGHLRALRSYYSAAVPVSAPKAPGRNDPCTCGSGAKYKKCCAVAKKPEAPAAPDEEVLAPSLADGILPRARPAAAPASVPPPASANDDGLAEAANDGDEAVVDAAAAAENQDAASGEHAAA